MVVLEGGGMLSTSGNQYLQPDYLSPLPTTLDAKKSPLALLAQTCSQIGADSPSTKPLMSSLDNKPKKNSTPPVREKPQPLQAQEKRSTPEHKVFKPYENNVVTKKEESRPSSKQTAEDASVKKQASSPEARKSVSPATAASTETSEKSSTPAASSESKTPPRGASPIIKSGLEILQGKDTPLYKPGGGFTGLNGPLSALCCPPGLEHTNPAFRPSFPGAPFSPHHHMLYPGASPGPYLSYARVKTPSGGEALVPVCKDPYCTSCQFSMHNQQLLMSGASSGPCPSGCTQCDHQKYNLAMAMSLVPPGPPPSSLGYPQLGRPNICSWVAGDSYCGKRFVTSEELLQHLRTHTNGTETVASTASSTSPFSHSLFSSASLHRAGYPNPPLSPLSAAARYHPYGKPPTMPTTLAASPYSAFNPTALGPYYSPYSVYGQRLGAAAVHP